MAARLRPRPRAGSPAMRRSCGTVGDRGRSRPRYGALSGRGIGAAGSRAVKTGFVDAHHVRHWAEGGESRLDYLILLCRHHHRAVHEGGYSVDGEGRFFYSWGGPIAPAPPLPRGDPSELVESNCDRTIDAGTCETGTGERLELAAVIDDLISIYERAARSTRAALTIT
jgi:hypothetical protein